MTNTKARHREILAAADRLLAHVDVTTPDYPFRALAKRLVELTNCHYSTARRNIARAARRKRGRIASTDNWGGARGGGRPPKEDETGG